jgi:hypothetical protein
MDRCLCNWLIDELRRMEMLRWRQPRVEFLDGDRLTDLAELEPDHLRLEPEPI